MTGNFHRNHSLLCPLILGLLLGLLAPTICPAAKKGNKNNNRQKLEQMRRQIAQQAAAQARILAQQIKVRDARIVATRKNMNEAREYMDRALSPMQQARTESEFAKRELTSAKRELNEVETTMLKNVPPGSTYISLKGVVEAARKQYEQQRRSVENKLNLSVKGVEREKQITAVPAVLTAQRQLSQAVNLLEKEKRTIGRESVLWSGARDRLNDRIGEEKVAQERLNERVSVYNRYRIAANKAQREMESCLQTKRVMLAQKRTAEQTARRYGYNSGSGRGGSHAGRSPGGKGK